MSRINDLVAKYPDLFGDGGIRTEMERLESQWMAEQEISDQEQIALASQPAEASLKARPIYAFFSESDKISPFTIL